MPSRFLSFLNQKPFNDSKERVRILLPHTEGKYYLQRASSIQGMFRVPGGGVDPGEDPQTAAVRELNEEFGIHPDFAKKHLHYLGRDYRDQYKHQHYFILNQHPVQERRYRASNDPDKEIVDMVSVKPDATNFLGPDLDLLLKHKKTAAFDLKTLLGGLFNANRTSAPSPVVRQEAPVNNGVLTPKPNNGPYFKVLALRNGMPLDMFQAVNDVDPEKKDPRQGSKPDDAWMTTANQPNTDAYWTSSGLKKYFDSGLFDWHRAMLGDDVAIMIAKKIENAKHSDEYRHYVEPASVADDDTYYVDKNRTTPLKASDLIARYSEQPKDSAYYAYVNRHKFRLKTAAFPLSRFFKPRPVPVEIPRVPAPRLPEVPPTRIPTTAIDPPKLPPPSEALPEIARMLPLPGPKPLPRPEPLPGPPPLPTAAPLPTAPPLPGPLPLPELSMPSPKPPAKPSRGLGGWLGDQLRYAGGLEPESPLLSWGNHWVPNPIRVPYNLTFRPKYPVVEPWLKQHGRFGAQYLPRAVRASATAGSLSGFGAGAYGALFDAPSNFAYALADEGALPPSEAERVGGNLQGTNALGIIADMFDPRNNDPFTRMHRDIARESFGPNMQHGLYLTRKRHPYLMGLLDASKLGTPMGMFSTVLSQRMARKEPPPMNDILRRNLHRYGPQIIDNPAASWRSPLREVYTDKIYDEQTLSNPWFSDQIQDRVRNRAGSELFNRVDVPLYRAGYTAANSAGLLEPYIGREASNGLNQDAFETYRRNLNDFNRNKRWGHLDQFSQDVADQVAPRLPAARRELTENEPPFRLANMFANRVYDYKPLAKRKFRSVVDDLLPPSK